MRKLFMREGSCSPGRRGRALVVALTLAVGPGLLAGCSGGSSTPAPAPAARAPEEIIAPPAKVKAGLQQIVALGDEAAAKVNSDGPAAKAAQEKIEPIWFMVEGAVKKNSRDLYLQIEDAQALLAQGVDGGPEARGKAITGAADQRAAVKAYLAQFPS
jgi:hypothetical protein